jgi:hypothetical protein
MKCCIHRGLPYFYSDCTDKAIRRA